MKTKLKIVVVTVIATTLAWALALAAWVCFSSRDLLPSERVQVQFLQETGALGMVEVRNPKTNGVFVAIEQLPARPESTNRAHLARERLGPGESVRIGVREVAEDGK